MQTASKRAERQGSLASVPLQPLEAGNSAGFAWRLTSELLAGAAALGDP